MVVPIILVPVGKEFASLVQGNDPKPEDFLAEADLKQLSAK